MQCVSQMSCLLSWCGYVASTLSGISISETRLSAWSCRDEVGFLEKIEFSVKFLIFSAALQCVSTGVFGQGA